MERAISLVAFSKVTKRYGEHLVLRDFDFAVQEGEGVALLGPSGSGKSTILRIMVALEGIDEGRVTIGDDVLWHARECRQLVSRREQSRARAGVSMVFQSYNLFPHMTVLGNVAAAPRHVLGVSREEATATAETLLARVGLREHLKKYPAQLSGGQQQRVAIARAMAMRPRILLFDEVTSSLDPELVGEVLDVIKDMIRERTVTALLVTHHVGVARAIADRVCFFEHGTIVEQGSPEQVIDSPASPRTREFLQRVVAS